MVSLKYLSNFWRTLEIPLIDCEINLQLKYSEKCILVTGTAVNQVPKFKITNTKFYVPAVTLSTQDNEKLLKQLESGFKRTINWNKRQSKKTNRAQKRYLGFLIDPSFQGVNRFIALSFDNEEDRESYSKCYFPALEIKKYNIMINGRNFFSSSSKI